MKLLFDQHVHFSDQMTKSEQRQDRTDQQIAALTSKVAELTDDLAQLANTQTVTMRAIASMVASDGELREAQKHTDAIVVALAESHRSTEATVAALIRRIDAFIAALGNGHKNP